MTIIEYFESNGFKTIKDTGKTWDEIGEQFGMSADAARKKLSRHWSPLNIKSEEAPLELKSQWEMMGKDGEIVTLRSFKVPQGKDILTVNDIDRICEKYAVQASKGPVSKSRSSMDTKHQIVALGDIHVGMACDDNVFNLKWNTEELFNRAKILVDSVDSGAQAITIVFGGDVADGQAGKTTRGLKGSSHHTLPQNLNDRQQIDTGCKFLTALLDGIVGKTEALIDCIFVTNSNHGGILDYSIGKIMEAICGSRYSGQVNWTNQLQFLGIVDTAHHRFVITHGYDDTHMNRGWSRFLSKDNEQLVERYLTNQKDCKDFKSNILLRFDQHQATDIRYNGFRDIVCPAFSNPSSWVSLNFGSDYKGGFTILNVNNDRIVTELVEF